MSSESGQPPTDLAVFDKHGRPVVHESRKPFRDPSGGCCNVLYAFALTELLGNRLGLSKRSIMTILQRQEDRAAGSWKWLTTLRATPEEAHVLRKIGEFGHAAIKNALRKLFEEYPIIVLKKDANWHIALESATERSKGGRPADIYVPNEGTTLGYPCGAQVMKILTSGIYKARPLRYSDLATYIYENHYTHVVPDVLKEIAKPPKVHTLRSEIEFLLRTRYLKLFTHEKGDRRRKEIRHSVPLHFKNDVIIELDERAAWESLYFDKLSQHFVNEEAKKLNSNDFEKNSNRKQNKG